MVKSKKKEVKRKKKVEEEESEDEEKGGMSLDDAFGDDEDVEYAPSKPKKEKKKKKDDLDDELDDAEDELEEFEGKVNGGEVQGPVAIKASKPISKVKKNDRVKVDGNEYIVDAHIMLIDHGSTKEMALELYDENDKDYQLRYFDDQAEATLEFYELQDIMYIKRVIKSVEW
jgi:hypothetical protein